MPPTYEYSCPRCFVITDVTKPIADLDSPEECPACAGQIMHRLISHVGINTSNCQFDAHFSHAFGKVVKSKRDVTNEISKIRHETGRDIVEVGNDSLKSIKKKRKAY